MNVRPLPAGIPPAFSVSEALAAGVSRDRLRRSDLDAPFYAARTSLARVEDPRRHLDALLRLCASYVPVARSNFCFSHVTAARLYRFPLPARFERRQILDVAVQKGMAVPRGRAVDGHRLIGIHRETAQGFPVVSPEMAWLQIADLLAPDELVAAGDHLLRHKSPLSTLERMNAAAARSRTRGVRAARAALIHVRAGTDSARETWMRLTLVRAHLPEPHIGVRVFEAGRYLGRPDLAYPTQKIAIEYEGDGHRSDPVIFQRDIARRERFEDAGWRVIRVTDADVRNPGSFIARVARVRAARS